MNKEQLDQLATKNFIGLCADGLSFLHQSFSHLEKPLNVIGGWPCRANGQPFNGLSSLHLMTASNYFGFTSPVWMTKKQMDALGYELNDEEQAVVQLPVSMNNEITVVEMVNGDQIKNFVEPLFDINPDGKRLPQQIIDANSSKFEIGKGYAPNYNTEDKKIYLPDVSDYNKNELHPEYARDRDIISEYSRLMMDENENCFKNTQGADPKEDALHHLQHQLVMLHAGAKLQIGFKTDYYTKWDEALSGLDVQSEEIIKAFKGAEQIANELGMPSVEYDVSHTPYHERVRESQVNKKYRMIRS